jgi:hypothetical protein
LLETLRDHPDRDAIIAHEMGWDRAEEEDDEESLEDPGLTIEETDEYQAAFGDEEGDEFEDDFDELESVPAYSVGYRWALKVHDALKPVFEAEEEQAVPTDEDGLDDYVPDEDVSQTLRCFEIAAKIAGGHGMGYDDEVLCGNIVCNRKSLAAANDSLEGLAALRRRGLLEPQTADELIREGEDVRELVNERIAKLRSRVWWT